MHLGRRDRKSRIFAFHNHASQFPQTISALFWQKTINPPYLLHHNTPASVSIDLTPKKRKEIERQTHQLATTKALLEFPFLSRGNRNCWEDKIHLDERREPRDQVVGTALIR